MKQTETGIGNGRREASSGHHSRKETEGGWTLGAWGPTLSIQSMNPVRPTSSKFLDLRKFENCLLATRGGVDEVYNLAADMGGIGYITAFHADISRNNILINTQMLEASRQNWSAALSCFLLPPVVYNQSKQKEAEVKPLCEERCLPGRPGTGAMAGKSSSPKSSATTTTETMVWKLASFRFQQCLWTSGHL